MRILFASALVAATTLSACESYAAGHATSPISEVESSLGTILADTNGMSLYTFDNDTAGTSNCYDSCADAWPPLMAGDDAHDTGKLTLVTRKDGAKQWAYDGEPLYYWAGDSEAGDVTGDGVGGVWHIAKP